MNPGYAIGKRVALILGAAFAVSAFIVVVPGDTFATGGGSYSKTGLDLKIDSSATYNGKNVPSATWALKDLKPGVDKFWSFDDIKPGDYGCNVISIHVKKSDAWACIDFENLQESENGINEPESHVDDDQTGELAAGTEFFGWIDDGDGKFEPPSEKALFGTTTQAASTVLDDTTYAVGDSKSGGSCKVDKTKYVGMCWCAGDLVVNPQTGQTTCDPTTLGNEAQTDAFSVDVVIRAEVAKDKPSFTCAGVEDGGGEGCSPGYWKQSQHFSKWVAPYSPSTQFSAVFENAFPGKTLLQVLGQGGGGLNALGRQTVAALLNAASPQVDYTYTTAEVIAKFNAVYPGGSSSYDTLKNDLEKQNTIHCPLGKDDDGDKDKDKKDDDHWKKDDKPSGNTSWGNNSSNKVYSFFRDLFRRT